MGAIVVHVRWNADDNHEITADVAADGASHAAEGGPWVCDTCRETQLRSKVMEVVPAVVALLPEAPDPSAPGSAPGATGRDGRTNGDRRGPKLGALEYTGIGVLTLGVGAVIAGSVLAVKGVEASVDGTQTESRTEKDFRPPGYALLGVGGAAILAGLGLVIGGRVKANRARRTTLAPSVGPSTTGLIVTGRF